MPVSRRNDGFPVGDGCVGHGLYAGQPQEVRKTVSDMDAPIATNIPVNRRK